MSVALTKDRHPSPVPSTDPATHAVPRSPSPTARPSGGRARLLAGQIAAEVRQNVRAPEYVIGVVAVPVILYAMFGLANAGQLMPGGTDVGQILVASFAAYGVVSLAIFTFGVDVAAERRRGWLRRLRATPMPMWAYFVGKLAMAMLFTAAIAALLLIAGRLGGVSLDVSSMARLVGVLLLGTLAFAPLGFALAFLATPKAATAIGNLIFLPLSFCSGFFMPLRTLPEVLQTLAGYLPTYHFGHLVWAQIAPEQDVAALTGETGGSLAVHAAIVAGTAVVCAALAAWGYVRDGRRERA